MTHLQLLLMLLWSLLCVCLCFVACCLWLSYVLTSPPSFPRAGVAVADVLLRSAQDRDAISAGVRQQRQGAFESIVWVDTGAAVGLA